MYDAARQPVASTEPKGAVTAYSRNNDGELVSTTDPLCKIISRTNSGDGQLSVLTNPGC